MLCTLPLPPISALQPVNTRQLDFNPGVFPSVLLCQVSGMSFTAFFWHCSTILSSLLLPRHYEFCSICYIILHFKIDELHLHVITYECVISNFLSLPVSLRFTIFLIYSLMEGFEGIIWSISSLFCSIFWTCKRE